MKKLFLIALILVMVLFTVACGQGNEAEQTDEPVQGSDAVQEATEDTIPEFSEELLKTGTVSEIMSSLKADDMEQIDNLYSKEELAGILNEAVKDEITAEEAEALGAVMQESVNIPNESPWRRNIEVIYDDDSIGIIRLFGNDKTDVTGVEIGAAGNERIAYYRNEELFDLMRRAKEAELMVDEEAFEKYGALAEKTVSTIFESAKEDLGFTDIKLVHFEQIWQDKDDEGNDILLFDYEYSIGVEDPAYAGLAGGMRFDYELRVRTSNGYYGQLAVKEKDGKVLKTALIDNDEMIWVSDDPTEEEKAFARSMMTKKLNE